MESKKYQLRYLPLFEQDLIDAAGYISNVLKNPLSFEPYRSGKKRPHPYYRIYVRNYVIYYVVIDDVIEVRRFLYGARDTDRHLS